LQEFQRRNEQLLQILAIISGQPGVGMSPVVTTQRGGTPGIAGQLFGNQGLVPGAGGVIEGLAAFAGG
jgi:hypothetical protein